MAIHTKQKKKSDREDYLAFHHFILEFLFVRSFINGNLDALLRCAFGRKEIEYLKTCCGYFQIPYDFLLFRP